MRTSRFTSALALVALVVAAFAGRADAAKPLKVYILAGQSNMEGQAQISTFGHAGDDPKTAGLLKLMRGADGTPRVCESAWISYYTGWRQFGEAHGRLTAGYGARPNPAESGGKIGPEFLFGISMDEAHDAPVLIIKTAWGGKSLNTDFRPPSAGPYELPPKIKELWAKHPEGAHGIPGRKDRDKWRAEKAEATGRYYRMMMRHVKKVLADPKRVCPAYDPKAGYELAGFVWFQGWNDMCDGTTYPDGDKPGGFKEYTTLMAHFIRDVRKELDAPKLPFVIGVIGVDGDKAKGRIANLRPAMAAVAKMPEFQGAVAAVETAPFWDHEMASLMNRKDEIRRQLEAAYLIGEDGAVVRPEDPGPGWEPIGKPGPVERVWRYTSFDPPKESDRMPETEKKRFRDVALPAGLETWYEPDFDDSEWQQGKAPVGKGEWKHRVIGKAAVKFNSDWGEGEFLLMRTTFHVDELDYASYRLCALARQGFHVYLNGHKIHTYIWWRDDPHYRPIPLEPSHARRLRKGKNVLAVYTTVDYDRRTKEPRTAVDMVIEGITTKGLARINSEQYLQSRMDKFCTRREQKIMAGASNGGYHYLGSAKIMAQIGKAFAEAMLEMEKK